MPQRSPYLSSLRPPPKDLLQVAQSLSTARSERLGESIAPTENISSERDSLRADQYGYPPPEGEPPILQIQDRRGSEAGRQYLSLAFDGRAGLRQTQTILPLFDRAEGASSPERCRQSPTPPLLPEPETGRVNRS